VDINQNLSQFILIQVNPLKIGLKKALVSMDIRVLDVNIKIKA
jgi:hypothetical protein